MLSARGHWRSTVALSTQGKLLDRAPHGGEIHAHQAHVAHARLDGLLHLDRRDALEAAGHRHLRDVLVERAER